MYTKGYVQEIRKDKRRVKTKGRIAEKRKHVAREGALAGGKGKRVFPWEEKKVPRTSNPFRSGAGKR